MAYSKYITEKIPQEYIEYQNIMYQVGYVFDSEIEYLSVQLLRGDIAQLNQVLHILIVVGTVFLVGWLITLRVLKRVLKEREILKTKVKGLETSLELSQKLYKLKNR